MRDNRGFGVLEVLFVVAIVAILAAIAVPSLQRSSANYSVTTAADQLASEIQTGRLLAAARNATFQMVFDTTNGTYQLIDPDDPNNPPRTQKSLPSGVMFQQAPASITFYSRGNTPGGTVQLGNDKFSLRLTVKTTEITTEQVY